MFLISKTNQNWKLKGLKNSLSIKTGNIDKWKLKRDVISNGIILHDKYSETPKTTKYYLMVNTETKNMKQSDQMRVWRTLYGYDQKIGKKIYMKKGMLEEFGGKKLSKSLFVIPMNKSQEILDFLNKNKVKYKLDEIWSDTI